MPGERAGETPMQKAATRALGDLLYIFEEMGSELTGEERDEISRVRFLLGEIEDGDRG